MEHKIFAFFKNTDGYLTEAVPAMLLLSDAHIQTIASAIRKKRPDPDVLNVHVELTHKCATEGPRLIPLQEKTSRNLSKPKAVAATINHGKGTMTVRLSYHTHIEGEVIVDSYESGDIDLTDITSKALLTDNLIASSILRAPDTMGYIEKALGKKLYDAMLAEMKIKKENLIKPNNSHTEQTP